MLDMHACLHRTLSNIGVTNRITHTFWNTKLQHFVQILQCLHDLQYFTHTYDMFILHLKALVQNIQSMEVENMDERRKNCLQQLFWQLDQQQLIGPAGLFSSMVCVAFLDQACQAAELCRITVTYLLRYYFCQQSTDVENATSFITSQCFGRGIPANVQTISHMCVQWSNLGPYAHLEVAQNCVWSLHMDVAWQRSPIYDASFREAVMWCETLQKQDTELENQSQETPEMYTQENCDEPCEEQNRHAQQKQSHETLPRNLLATNNFISADIPSCFALPTEDSQLLPSNPLAANDDCERKVLIDKEDYQQSLNDCKDMDSVLHLQTSKEEDSNIAKIENQHSVIRKFFRRMVAVELKAYIVGKKLEPRRNARKQTKEQKRNLERLTAVQVLQQERDRCRKQRLLKILFVVRRYVLCHDTKLRQALEHRVHLIREKKKAAFVETEAGQHLVYQLRLTHSLLLQLSFAIIPCFARLREIEPSIDEILRDYAKTLTFVLNPNIIEKELGMQATTMVALHYCDILLNVQQIKNLRTVIQSYPLLAKFENGIWSLLKHVPRFALQMKTGLPQLSQTGFLQVYENNDDADLLDTKHDDNDVLQNNPPVPIPVMHSYLQALPQELQLLWVTPQSTINQVVKEWLAKGGVNVDLIRLIAFVQRTYLKSQAMPTKPKKIRIIYHPPKT